MKKLRKIKVHGQGRMSIRRNDYSYKRVPNITLAGLWPAECGFGIDDMINVNVSDGKLIITKA